MSAQASNSATVDSGIEINATNSASANEPSTSTSAVGQGHAEDARAARTRYLQRSERHLLTFLAKANKVIKKAEEAELSLEDMEEESYYSIGEKLKAKAFKAYKELRKVRAELKIAAQESLQRPVHCRFKYDVGTRFSAVNAAVEKFVNSCNVKLGDNHYRLPSWDDLKELLVPINKDQSLGLNDEEIDQMAIKIAEDIKKFVQRRRRMDFALWSSDLEQRFAPNEGASGSTRPPPAPVVNRAVVASMSSESDLPSCSSATDVNPLPAPGKASVAEPEIITLEDTDTEDASEAIATNHGATRPLRSNGEDDASALEDFQLKMKLKANEELAAQKWMEVEQRIAEDQITAESQEIETAGEANEAGGNIDDTSQAHDEEEEEEEGSDDDDIIEIILPTDPESAHEGDVAEEANRDDDVVLLSDSQHSTPNDSNVENDESHSPAIAPSAEQAPACDHRKLRPDMMRFELQKLRPKEATEFAARPAKRAALTSLPLPSPKKSKADLTSTDLPAASSASVPKANEAKEIEVICLSSDDEEDDSVPNHTNVTPAVAYQNNAIEYDDDVDDVIILD